MFFEFIDDTADVLDHYLASFSGVPSFNISRVLPEIIREYEDLVLGSQICIKISFHLKANGFDVGPEVVAREIFPKVLSTPSREYFLGRDVYLNAKLNVSEGLKEYLNQGSESTSLFLSKSKFVSEISTRVFNEENLSGKFVKGYEDLFLKEPFLSVASKFGEVEKKHIYLSSISDEEFDESLILNGLAGRDNTIWLWAKFNEIVEFYFAQRSEGFEAQFHEGAIKSSLHTVPATHQLLKSFHERLATFISLYDYYLFEALKRDKPKLFWVHVMEIERLTLSLWNDPWGRLSIEGRSVKGDSGELDILFNALRLCRSKIVSLLD